MRVGEKQLRPSLERQNNAHCVCTQRPSPCGPQRRGRATTPSGHHHRRQHYWQNHQTPCAPSRLGHHQHLWLRPLLWPCRGRGPYRDGQSGLPGRARPGAIHGAEKEGRGANVDNGVDSGRSSKNSCSGGGGGGVIYPTRDQLVRSATSILTVHQSCGGGRRVATAVPTRKRRAGKEENSEVKARCSALYGKGKRSTNTSRYPGCPRPQGVPQTSRRTANHFDQRSKELRCKKKPTRKSARSHEGLFDKLKHNYPI